MNHIQIPPLARTAVVPPSDMSRTAVEPHLTVTRPLKTAQKLPFLNVTVANVGRLLESCWLVSCYIWLEVLGGDAGQH